MILPPSTLEQGKTGNKCLHHRYTNGVFAIVRTDMCLRIFQVGQDIRSHQIATIPFAVQFRTVFFQRILHPGDISKAGKHLKVFIWTEEIADTAPVLLLRIIHLRTVDIVQHQIYPADIVVIPFLDFICCLRLLVCPLPFISGQTFDHIVRLKISAEYFVRLPRIIRISEEYII